MGIDLNRFVGCNGDDISTPKDLKSEEPCSSDSEKDVFGSAIDIALDIERRLEVGTIVAGVDEVYVLYCEYARCKGFSVRKGCQKYFQQTSEIRMKIFNCSCEGDPDNKRSMGRVAAYKKQVTRTNCKARIRVVRERNGPWRISIFHKPHNHELVDPDQSYLLRSARNLTIHKKAVLESLCGAGIPVSRACKFMEKESGHRQNVGFLRSDAYTHIGSLKTESKVENGDANALLQFFIDKSNNDPFFYWKVQLDDDSRLMNFFFRDGRCLIDYECFGDALSIDTTYKTNKYDMVCAPFVGINHHCQNVMFGLAFLSDEKTQSFDWLFGAFLESMYGKEPEVIFSDQCTALINGIDGTFEHAKHRLCQWHINQNAPAHFGSLNGDKNFKKMWYRCMNGCDTVEEFEDTWNEMVGTYDLIDNKWFSSMYNLRRRWSSVFTNNRFCAGLHATSRSEVTNKVLKELGKRSNTLFEFVLNYMQIQDDWRARERAEDALCRGMPGQYVEGNKLLTGVAKVVTRAVYKLFEYEATQSLNVRVEIHPADYCMDELVFQVRSTSGESRSRLVTFNKLSFNISCTCRMWETKGVLCCHIFKVIYLMDLESIPEKYLLNRWRRDAKLRCEHHMSNAHTRSSVGDEHSDILFVNHIMRVVYDIAYNSKGNAALREHMNDRIYKLRVEMLGNDKDHVFVKHQAKRKAPLGKHMKDPKIARTRGCGGLKVRKKWVSPKKKVAVSTAGLRKKVTVPDNTSVHKLSGNDSARAASVDAKHVLSQGGYELDFGLDENNFGNFGCDDSIPYTWL